MEVETKTSEDVYRMLVDHSFDVLIQLGQGGRILYISPAIGRYGYAPEELVGRTLISLVFPEDVDRFKQLATALLVEGGPVIEGPARDWRLLTKSGEGVWVEGRSTTLRREQGRPIEMAVSLREVAARRQARSDMTELAARYRLLADSSTDVILRYDIQGRIEFASPAVGQFGYEPDQVVGRNFLEFAHPDDRDEVWRRHQRLVAGDGADQRLQEIRARRADGDWVWLEASRSPITDDFGRVVGGVSTLRDITERKAAQAALAESEARYRLLADKSTDLILRYDTAGVIEFASPAARQFGYQPEQLIGRNLLEFSHPDDTEAVVGRMRSLLQGDEGAVHMSGESRARTASGEFVWLQSNPSVIRDPDGTIIGAVSMFRDVTERREMEDELRRKQAAAEAAAVAKSEFLANMSHEVRTPLTAIIGFAGLLGTIEDLPPTAAKYASRITTASQTLLAVVNDVLDFSKIEAGRIQLDPAPFDPAAFIKETLELVAGQAAAKGLTLSADIDGHLPAGLQADSSRVRQVLFNLLGNAIKFTSAGEVRVEARYLPGEGEAGTLRIAVTDTGVGIAKEALDRLFQRFSQVDGSISRRFGGTGLGLAICKSLAELMGGAIGVASEEGRGSTFWFTVAAPRVELAASPLLAQGPALCDGAPARILIVDDLAVNRELVGVMLSTVGYDLTEAANGLEAVEAALHRAYDLILMDMQMPGMDGLAATRAIRQTCDLNRKTPIVALSADVMPDQLERCREAGMDDHIAKPINPAELIGKVALWSASAAP